jgi:hypothetical protein
MGNAKGEGRSAKGEARRAKGGSAKGEGRNTKYGQPIVRPAAYFFEGP